MRNLESILLETFNERSIGIIRRHYLYLGSIGLGDKKDIRILIDENSPEYSLWIVSLSVCKPEKGSEPLSINILQKDGKNVPYGSWGNIIIISDRFREFIHKGEEAIGYSALGIISYSHSSFDLYKEGHFDDPIIIVREKSSEDFRYHIFGYIDKILPPGDLKRNDLSKFEYISPKITEGFTRYGHSIIVTKILENTGISREYVLVGMLQRLFTDVNLEGRKVVYNLLRTYGLDNVLDTLKNYFSGRVNPAEIIKSNNRELYYTVLADWLSFVFFGDSVDSRYLAKIYRNISYLLETGNENIRVAYNKIQQTIKDNYYTLQQYKNASKEDFLIRLLQRAYALHLMKNPIMSVCQ